MRRWIGIFFTQDLRLRVASEWRLYAQRRDTGDLRGALPAAFRQKSMRLEKIHRACTCFFVALCCATLLFAFATAARAETALQAFF